MNESQYASDEEFINDVLLQFCEELIAQRIENVKKEKAVASQELINSYAFEIRKATMDQAALAMIAFEDKGRYLDMKRLSRNQLIPISALEKWIEDVGLNAFKRLPRGLNGRSPKNSRELMNRLAWGIAIGKKGKRKKRKKLARGMGSLVQELIVELAAGYQDRTIEDIKDIFKN